MSRMSDDDLRRRELLADFIRTADWMGLQVRVQEALRQSQATRGSGNYGIMSASGVVTHVIRQWITEAV